MRYKLVLEISEEVYEPLARKANETGRSLEEVAIGCLVSSDLAETIPVNGLMNDAKGVRQSSDDPVEEFIGALGSTVPDWADRHDEWIAH